MGNLRRIQEGVTAFPRLILSLQDSITDSKSVMDIKMHRTKCSAVIKNVLAPHFKQMLFEDIGSQKYSVLLDESTDLSVSKLLGIVIRYFSCRQNKVVSAFLALEPLSNADARGIVTALVNCLQAHDKYYIGKLNWN